MVTWSVLALSICVAACFLLLPGYVWVRALDARPTVALGVAPLISLALLGVLALAYGAIGVACNWASLVLAPVFLGLLVCAMRYVRRRKEQSSSSGLQKNEQKSNLEKCFANTRLMTSAYVLALVSAIAVTCAVYISSMSSSDAFTQTYDNAFHLSRIEVFSRTLNFSSLSNGFYPSAWHALAALVKLALNIPSSVAETAANVAFVAFAYPLSMTFLLAVLFPEKPRQILLGALAVLSVSFFPWRIFIFGPLFPNVAAFSVMPAECALFIILCEGGHARRMLIQAGVLFVAGGIALVLTQPNAIFSCAVFLIPFLSSRARTFYLERAAASTVSVADGSGTALSTVVVKKALAVEILSALVLAGMWVMLTLAPPLHDVVTYIHEPALEPKLALVWLLNLSFISRRPQYFLGLVIVLGLIAQLVRGRRKWLVGVWVLTVCMFVAAASLNWQGKQGLLKNLLSGFWYNDYFRIAALYSVFAIPLIATGLEAVVALVATIGNKVQALTKDGTIAGSSEATKKGLATAEYVGIGLACVLLGLSYWPWEFVPEHYRSWAFPAVQYELNLELGSDEYNSLGKDEMAFVRRVMDVMPKNAKVFNNPHDGSVFAFPAEGLNVYYKDYSDVDGDPWLIRTRLNEIASNPDVQRAVRESGVQYVIQLDQGIGYDARFAKDGFYNPDQGKGHSIYDFGYSVPTWAGIDLIRDSTPGFTVVLSEGDMRLYKIDE